MVISHCAVDVYGTTLIVVMATYHDKLVELRLDLSHIYKVNKGYKGFCAWYAQQPPPVLVAPKVQGLSQKEIQDRMDEVEAVFLYEHETGMERTVIRPEDYPEIQQEMHKYLQLSYNIDVYMRWRVDLWGDVEPQELRGYHVWYTYHYGDSDVPDMEVVDYSEDAVANTHAEIRQLDEHILQTLKLEGEVAYEKLVPQYARRLQLEQRAIVQSAR